MEGNMDMPLHRRSLLPNTAGDEFAVLSNKQRGYSKRTLQNVT